VSLQRSCRRSSCDHPAEGAIVRVAQAPADDASFAEFRVDSCWSWSDGSGKSTTRQHRRSHQPHPACHIITIEDPIEHAPVAERWSASEVGIDTVSFARGLKSVLRMDPDVIPVGEMLTSRRSRGGHRR
jgi:hypothetical protein